MPGERRPWLTARVYMVPLKVPYMPMLTARVEVPATLHIMPVLWPV